MSTAAELKQIFDHFAGKDQSLDRREFVRVLEHMGLPTSKRTVNALLAAVDDDGSGNLSFEEFKSIFLPGDDEEAQDDVDVDEAHEVFDLFSGNDGSLSLKELKRAFCSLGLRFSSKQARQLLQDADSDRSGTLNFDEFLSLYRNLARQQAQEQPPANNENAHAGMFDYSYGSPTHRKEVSKAVFIGINYKGTSAELRGCVNDVRLLRNTITKTLNLPIAEHRVLVEDTAFPGYVNQPTAATIKESMKWLAAGAKPGDTLVFHYSGHGGSMTERVKGSEASGQDQCIFPVDYNKSGVILDDDIFNTLVKPLPPGVRLTAIFDCCHSGSIMDLPYTATCVDDTTQRDPDNNSAISGSVVMLSGCRDDQTSADAYQGEGTYGGALTYALATTLSDGKTRKIVDLLKDMRGALRGKYTQVPQMASSHPFNLEGNFTLFGASVDEL